jgi:SAM-dependent methyltransferase
MSRIWKWRNALACRGVDYMGKIILNVRLFTAKGGVCANALTAKLFLKRVLPESARLFLHRANIWLTDRKLRNLERGEVFDTIYRDRLWGGSEAQPSGYGSVGEHALSYIDFVHRFVRENSIRSILDIGCGDFAIGSKICPVVEEYVAADVSAVIIARNQQVFAGIANTRFTRIDLCTDALPPVDLITVREVLQHLSNADIKLALENLERSVARYALITEHLPAGHALAAPNLDKPRGPNIRNPFGSGVYIDQPPFSRTKTDVLSVKHPSFATAPSYLVTSLWDLKA